MKNSFQNTSTITTGLSGFDKIVITVLKTTFAKSEAKVITYRDCKLLDKENFKADLKNSLRDTNVLSCSFFEKNILHVL